MTLIKPLASFAVVVSLGLMPLASCGDSQGDLQAMPTVVMADEQGHAVNGYDPVSYFTVGKPELGRTDLATTWNNARWLFANRANRDRFIADPERYAPAYGGWCAYGVAEGYAAETDPVRAWTVYKGRLYLNWDEAVARQWSQDTDGYIEQSELSWPELSDGLKTGSATIYRK